MKTLLALAAVLALSAPPAMARADLIQTDRPAPDCGPSEPETTGSLPADPRRLGSPAGRPDGVEALASEEPWQEQAEEDAERRRERLVMCGVD